MPDITSICRSAWNGSKKPHQPEYDDLIESYRTMLQARAEGAIASGVSEDAPFQPFETAVIGYVEKAPDGLTEIEDIEPFHIEESVEVVPEPTPEPDERPWVKESVAEIKANTGIDLKPKIVKKPATKKAVKKVAPKK